MPQKIYLDSNCLAYLYGDPLLQGWSPTGIGALRAAARTAAEANRIAFVGSHFHLEETSRIPNESTRRQFIDFYWDLVRWNMLLPVQHLARDEGRLHRALENNEPFEEFWRRQWLRTTSRDKTKFTELAREVGKYKDVAFANAVARQRTATAKLKRRFKNLSPAAVTQKWGKSAAKWIDDWMGDYLRANEQQFGFPQDKALWPAPTDLPTAWAIHAYQMARIVRTVGFGAKIQRSDPHDTFHYASACYADIFVTEDREFRKTVQLIPGNPLTVLRFDAFARQHGINPH